MEVLREISVIFLTEMRRQVRSAKGMTLLILYGLGAGIAGGIFVWVTRSASANLNIRIEGSNTPKLPFLAWVYGTDRALLEYLSEVPGVVLFIFWASLKFLPWFVLIIGFDQLSGELGSRSMRFVAIRARRVSLVVGKYLAQMGLLALVTFLVEGALFALAAAVTPEFNVGVGLVATARFWLVSLAFSATYMGIVAFTSSWFRSSWFSLLAGACCYFAFWLIYVVSKLFDSLAPLAYVTPTHYEGQLVQPSAAELLPAVGAYLGFAVVFVVATTLVMKLRDL